MLYNLEDKKNFLELYNAMTGKDYKNPEELEINTLENAIYMSMKNDVSFIIDGRLSLYEHQSIRNGVLKEFLEKNRSEAMKVSIYEYDQKKHMEMEREEGREKALLELVRDGMITIEYAAERLKTSVEELKKKL